MMKVNKLKKDKLDLWYLSVSYNLSNYILRKYFLQNLSIKYFTHDLFIKYFTHDLFIKYFTNNLFTKYFTHEWIEGLSTLQDNSQI